MFYSTTGEILIENDPLPGPSEAGRTFNGFRLCFENGQRSLDKEKTGWNATAKTNLQFDVSPFKNNDILPYDIKIRFFDHVMDSSHNHIALNFEVINSTLSEKECVHVFQKDEDSTVWQPEDRFIIFRPEPNLTKLREIRGEFPDGQVHIKPTHGDVFTIVNHKSFS